MKDTLEIIMEEREYDTVPLSSMITKNTQETIYRFSVLHNIDYDVALEVLVTEGASNPLLWRKSLNNEND